MPRTSGIAANFVAGLSLILVIAVLWQQPIAHSDDNRVRNDRHPTTGKICGTEERLPAPYPRLKPWVAICETDSRFPSGGQLWGTAFLITDRILLTAGHNVYKQGTKELASTVNVWFGGSKSTGTFGQITNFPRQYQSQKVYINSLYKSGDQSGDWDYGVILLTEPIRFNGLAAMASIESTSASVLANKTMYLSGYPKDHAGTQWYSSGVVKAFNQRQLTYQIDTEEGQSGSPLWIPLAPELGQKGFNGTAYAIHIRGGSCDNRARIIDVDVMNLVQEAINDSKP